METIPAEIRRTRMLDLIREREFMRVADLSNIFHISEVTVRSDLDLLAMQSLVQRVHGGAILASGRRRSEPTFEESESTSSAEKTAIGKAAASLISSGETLILDVGTTAAAAARAITSRRDLEDVVVFTSGLNIALQLEKSVPALTVVVTGGTLRPRQHSLVDPLADAILSQVSVNTAIIGCNGIHPDEGVTNINLPEAMVKRRMVAAAQRCIVVADGSKVDTISLAKVADISEIDMLITGSSAPAEAINQMRDMGLTVQVVES